jgi:hypothetical protein
MHIRFADENRTRIKPLPHTPRGFTRIRRRFVLVFTGKGAAVSRDIDFVFDSDGDTIERAEWFTGFPAGCRLFGRR